MSVLNWKGVNPIFWWCFKCKKSHHIVIDLVYFCVLCILSFYINLSFLLFSSPEPKAQVIFFDHNLSVVHHRCRWHCCCRKLFTFSSSSPEPLGQFQPKLTQSIFGWWGFKFVQMKVSTLFHEEKITKLWKYIENFEKSSSPEPLGQLQPNLAKNILG